MQRVAFTQPEMDTPFNGAYENYSRRECLAPLRIEASYGESNYFVKLVDKRSNESVFSVFVHGGRTVEVDVPLGTYEMRYAAGEKWYGMTYLFGPATGYSKADAVFTFSQNSEGYSGYTVQLKRVPHGNLRTSQISADNF